MILKYLDIQNEVLINNQTNDMAKTFDAPGFRNS
jgi:hypothetical protein